jgi:hypothetical protein
MIREASRHDLPACIEMLRQYSAEAGVPALRDPAAHDAKHAANLLFTLISGRGFVLLDDDMRGMLAAVVAPSIWAPSVLELRELALWVAPEHRRGMVGGRLFCEFRRRADVMLHTGRVQAVYASLMASSGPQNLPGFRKIDSTFLKV